MDSEKYLKQIEAIEAKEKDVEDLLNRFIGECNKQQGSMPYNFNVLDEQCGHIVENSHTNLLMKLLQYKNQYGYIFLDSFFRFLEMPLSIEPEKDIIFDKERHLEGNQKNGRIDGFIYQENNFALIIENKVNHANPTKDQIKTYIEGLQRADDITDIDREKGVDKIWIIYLTEDGRDKPDNESIKKMYDCGILSENNDAESEEISGPRYFAVNYQDHILPWLKNEIQPIVMQREHVLNTGLLQYIDFLEGMLGIRQQDLALMDNCKGLLDEDVYIKKIKEESSFAEQNKQLAEIVNKLIEIQNNIKNTDKEEDKRKYYSAGILKKLLEDINEEPMKKFFDISRFYFESKNLMKECVIHPVFNFKYIQIRDASWPRSVHFEWSPLSIEKLTVNKKKEYTFCFHVESKDEYRLLFKQQKEIFKDSYFSLKQSKETSRTLSYYRTIKYEVPIMDMDEESLKTFLEKVYNVIKPGLIECINNIVKQMRGNKND